MLIRKFKQVDVFSTGPFSGNPVAVVLEADGLSDEQMHRFAAWTNLSETTFVLPPSRAGADYRLRIFTPVSEIDFAGHPTVGSAYAILEAGLVKPKSGCMVQECQAGLLQIRVEGEGSQRKIFAQTPEPKITIPETGLVDDIRRVLKAPASVKLTPLLVNNGPHWLVVELDDPDEVHRLKPDFAAMKELSQKKKITGLVPFGLTGKQPYAVYLRAFAPVENVPEDPVCGSGNACVGAFLYHFDKLKNTGTSYMANQGLELGRNGAIAVSVDPKTGAIEIGGACFSHIDGVFQL